MRRKYIWVWIVCLALVLCGLSVFFLFGNRESDETAKTSAPQESAPASTIHSDTVSNESGSASQEGQTAPAASSDTGKPGNDEPDIHETVIAQESSVPSVTEPEESSPSQQESETESAPDNTDDSTEDNGDVLLPEVP